MSDANDSASERHGTGRFEALRRWRVPAFLVAAILLLLYTVANGFEAFTDVAPPRWVGTFTVVPALIVGHVGLLGFYPTLAPRVRRQAQLAAGAVLLAMTAALGLFVVEVGGTLTGEQFAIAGLFYLVMVVMTALGFVLVSVGSFRAGTPSRLVAFLLLLPPAEFVLMMTGSITGFTPAWSTFLLSGLQAVAHFAIGYVLRVEFGRSRRREPSVDTVEG